MPGHATKRGVVSDGAIKVTLLKTHTFPHTLPHTLTQTDRDRGREPRFIFMNIATLYEGPWNDIGDKNTQTCPLFQNRREKRRGRKMKKKNEKRKKGTGTGRGTGSSEETVSRS